MKAQFIDSHAHLAAPDYKEDVADVITRANQAGVCHIVVIGAGYGKQSAQDAIDLADQYECLSVAAGLHPCDSFEPIDSSWLHQIAGAPKVKALGETGLDYYWNKTDPQIQKYNLQVHIEVAKERQVPLIIHSRAAAEDCYQELKTGKADQVGGVFHCFSENVEFAKRLADINFLVSFPGVLTFKKADEMRQIAKEIPLQQIMIETDCPFLAPQRVRGKRCEPAHVVDVAFTLAEIKGISVEEVARITTETASRFFKIEI